MILSGFLVYHCHTPFQLVSGIMTLRTTVLKKSQRAYNLTADGVAPSPTTALVETLASLILSSLILTPRKKGYNIIVLWS